ncbi:AraC-like DNA-binding protein/HAMP domain-containing protein [Anaerotaenia torta]|uniref:AraC family transcriptional regulator n=1 Tax=Anaerotaenia torta TaxID=433293 RepID=UPI003D1F58F3
MLRGIFRFKTRDRIFYSYLFSYLVIGVLPILVSLFAYINYGKVVLEDIHTSQSYALSQLKYSFDDNLETVLKTGNLLAENERLGELMNAPAFSQDSLLKAWKLKDEINTMKSTINFCSEIFVYFYASDNIITSTKLYSSQINYIFAGTYQLTREELLGVIDTPNYYGYEIIEDKEGNKTLLFLQNVYSYNYKDRMATIVTVVPWKNIAANIALLEEGHVYWINRDNRILQGSDAAYTEVAVTYDEYNHENRLIEKHVEGIKYVNSYMKSDYFDFKYCITMPKSYYLKEMNSLVGGIILQITVMAALAFVLAWYYSVRNYKPISRLSAALRKNKKAAKEINFSSMENYIENLYTENRTLSNSWEQARDALLNQRITGYVKGWNRDEAMAEDVIGAGTKVSLENSYLAMAVTYVDIMDCSLFKGIKDSEKEKTFQLLKFVFYNIFEENIFSKYAGFFCEIDGRQLCILNISEEEAGNGSLAYDIRKCLNTYKSLFNLKVNIGSSKLHRGIEELPKAYEEAVLVLSFQAFWGGEFEAFTFYEDSGMGYDVIAGSDGQLLEKQKKLYNLIMTREYSQAAEYLNQLLEEMFLKEIPYMEMNRCRLSALIYMVYDALSEMIGRNEREFFRRLRPMERMLKIDSIASAKRIMGDLFREITENAQRYLENEYPCWVQEIINFVNENYGDPNLSVSILADKLSMNLSYVGRTFKNYTGCGIMDMIHIRRVEECKRRLLLGESVREAAEALGYLDSKSLIRIFKRYEGITPGQYKSNFEKQMLELA